MAYQTYKRFTIVKRCYHYNRSGHYKKEYPEIQCRNCRKFGHISLECESKRCYKCEGRGYKAHDCPNEMSKTYWICDSVRSETYLVSQGKTFYTCIKCCKIDNSEGANLPEENVEFWSSKQEVKDEINLVDRKLIRGTKAQKIFSSHFDIVNNILNILKGNLMDSDGHQDFKNICQVNQFIYYNFIHYWIRDDAQRKMVYKEVVDYIPRGI